MYRHSRFKYTNPYRWLSKRFTTIYLVKDDAKNEDRLRLDRQKMTIKTIHPSFKKWNENKSEKSIKCVLNIIRNYIIIIKSSHNYLLITADHLTVTPKNGFKLKPYSLKHKFKNIPSIYFGFLFPSYQPFIFVSIFILHFDWEHSSELGQYLSC